MTRKSGEIIGSKSLKGRTEIEEAYLYCAPGFSSRYEHYRSSNNGSHNLKVVNYTPEMILPDVGISGAAALFSIGASDEFSVDDTVWVRVEDPDLEQSVYRFDQTETEDGNHKVWVPVEKDYNLNGGSVVVEVQD